MFRRIANGTILITLLTGWSILGNCGNAWADFLPANPTKPADSLFASENSTSGFGIGDQTSECFSTTSQASDNLVPAPDGPDKPLVRCNLLYFHAGILSGRGNNSTGGTGAGGSTGQSNSSDGAPGAISNLPPPASSSGTRIRLVRERVAGISRPSSVFEPPRFS